MEESSPFFWGRRFVSFDNRARRIVAPLLLFCTCQRLERHLHSQSISLSRRTISSLEVIRTRLFSSQKKSLSLSVSVCLSVCLSIQLLLVNCFNDVEDRRPTCHLCCVSFCSWQVRIEVRETCQRSSIIWTNDRVTQICGLWWGLFAIFRRLTDGWRRAHLPFLCLSLDWFQWQTSIEQQEIGLFSKHHSLDDKLRTRRTLLWSSGEEIFAFSLAERPFLETTTRRSHPLIDSDIANDWRVAALVTIHLRCWWSSDTPYLKNCSGKLPNEGFFLVLFRPWVSINRWQSLPLSVWSWLKVDNRGWLSPSRALERRATENASSGVRCKDAGEYSESHLLTWSARLSSNQNDLSSFWKRQILSSWSEIAKGTVSPRLLLFTLEEQEERISCVQITDDWERSSKSSLLSLRMKMIEEEGENLTDCQSLIN